MKKMMMIVVCLLLASCRQSVENEKNAVIKVAVHSEAYKESLGSLWENVYPDAALEISVVSQEEINTKLRNHEHIDYDVYWLEDAYIPLAMDQLMEVDEYVEVELNPHFHDVFDRIKKVYQPMMAKGNMYYALDLDKIEEDEVELSTFDSMEEISQLTQGFYYLDDPYFTLSFLTSDVEYFPGKEKSVINFTGNSFKEALLNYQDILALIPCDDASSFDNWFIQNTYYSGFVTEDMQLQADEEINQGHYQITRLPSINGHALYTQAVSYGYVINQDTEYPNTAQNLLSLMHSIKGMQLLCNDDLLIPLIMENQLDEFTFANDHSREKAYALNYALSRNWVGIENKSEGAFDFLLLDSTIEKLKACDIEKIDECQQAIDKEYQEWLK